MSPSPKQDGKIVDELRAGDLIVYVCNDEQIMGGEAANRVIDELRYAYRRSLTPVLWLMAAPSGFAFYEALVARAKASTEISRMLDGIDIYQFDDYPISRESPRFPVTFRALLENRVITPFKQEADITPNWHPLELTGEEGADDAVMAQYRDALLSLLDSSRHHVVEVKGIGMDGHWGFHGGETPLDAPAQIMRVPMNAENVAQQMIDWPEYFGNSSDVPADAISCNVALFMRADAIVDVVPQASKEYSVLAAYGTGEVVSAIPSSAATKHENAVSFVTQSAARALLEYRERAETGVSPPLSAATIERLKRIWQDPEDPERAQGSVESMMTILEQLGIWRSEK